ncbi:helix-turn-helix transcriptional regulator [Streptomyces sp. NBS 14/10]|uniref:helix-turn-helix domain-containing protein n=1 Tax=Streptomyces sp. NBS 14/10 TaxID=1945643 RepID=UPI00211B0455|nr:helix-turn-helix transcriptional regulator [Streptomyces sp. NBS 14/10]KAK1183211.1 helix-turn-helix transcriptional regulator [Streptomyces sp. NBS 14/10]
MSNGEEITEFAESLRRLKDRSGQSYGALATRLHVSTSTLHRYCNGDAVPAEYAPVERFARLCGATSEELIALHRRWLLADAARRAASGRGGSVPTTTPDGASGRATAKRGSAAPAAGAPDPAGRTAGPPTPTTPTVGAAETEGRTADGHKSGRAADPRHHPSQAARTPGPAGQSDREQDVAGLTADRHDAAGQAAAEGGDEERRSAADTDGEPRGAERPRATAGSPIPTGRRNFSPPAEPDHRPPAPSAAQARGTAAPNIGQPRAPFAPAASPAAAPREGDRPIVDEGGPGPAESGAGRTADCGADGATGLGGPLTADAAVSGEPGPRVGRDTAVDASSARTAEAHATPAEPSRARASEADGTAKDATTGSNTSARRATAAFGHTKAAPNAEGVAGREAGQGGASGAGGVGAGPGARGGDGPSAERQRARAGGDRPAVGGNVARGGRAAGAAGRGRGAAGRGALWPVPAVDGAGRRTDGRRAWRRRPWGLVLGAAAAAVLALTAVEVRSTTGGEREEAATSPSSPSSPAPSAPASGTAPSTRPTARGELKKDDTADGRESASPRGGKRRGGASASASPRQGGSSGGGSGGGRDDKPGSGTPLTISTRSHVWENGCGHRYLINRPPTQVAPPPVEQDAAAWASAHGAVHGGTTNVEMTVKGRSESAVVLQALHVRVVGRRTSLPWSSFTMDNGCGGSLTPRAFSVNLDAARPLAVPTDGNDAGEQIPAVRFPYRVSDTDPEVLLVNARTSGCDCSWYLELDWTSGDREGTIRIDDHGAPFRTSGVKGRPEYGYQFEEQVWRRND